MNILDYIKIINPSILIEIGAHFGTETLKFRNILPKCRIISFEPDPRNIKLLRDQKIDEICTLEELAVSNNNGLAEFHLSSGDCKSWASDPILRANDWSASSSLKKPKEHLDVHRWVHFEQSIKVKSIRLDDYIPIKDKVVDFIWMDVQGAEDLVLEGAKKTIERTRYIYTEYNNKEMYEGQMNLNQILETLNNWEVVQLYSDDVLLKNKCL
jgi:FkbM family methyltransferase